MCFFVNYSRKVEGEKKWKVKEKSVWPASDKQVKWQEKNDRKNKKEKETKENVMQKM